MSYHLVEIPKGVFGEVSKIVEEALELQDANAQNAKVMALNELSDLVGAIKGYLEKHHKDTTFDDIVKMAELTDRAFKSGRRS